jgi:hypothetical protein
LMLYRFLINYDEMLYNDSINWNILVNDAINVWNVSFKTFDYSKYNGRSIDSDTMKTQIYHLQSTKIFTVKNRLNGEILEYFINHTLFDVENEIQDKIAYMHNRQMLEMF